MPEQESPDSTKSRTIKHRLDDLYFRFRSLQGDPHYVALGMAIGVFVAVTPTIPFHTAIALAMAFVLRASKPAAIIGVWFSNPLTIPPFYYGSYKLGMLMLGREIVWSNGEVTIQELMQQGLDVTVAMIAGGAVLGVVPAVIFYFVTLIVFRKIRARRGRAKEEIGKGENPSGRAINDSTSAE